MLLRGGGCRFCGGFRSVNNNGLLTAFGGSGVDGIQVDAFGREFVQTFRQSSRLVGQIVGFRGSFLIRDACGVKGFLGAPSIFHDELHRASRALGGSEERENIHLGVAKGSRNSGDRTRLIINSDCELLGFSHFGTSCRFAKIIRPDRPSGGGDLRIATRGRVSFPKGCESATDSSATADALPGKAGAGRMTMVRLRSPISFESGGQICWTFQRPRLKRMMPTAAMEASAMTMSQKTPLECMRAVIARK